MVLAMLTAGLAIDRADIPESPDSAPVEQFCQGEMTAPVLTELLKQYGLLPKLLQEMIVDQAIASIHCDPQAVEAALQQFYLSQGITSPAELEAAKKHPGFNLAQIQQQIERNLRLDRFKQQTWGHRLESQFLTLKPQLDQITYSLLRLQDFAMAQEIFFRIQSGEQSFAEAAQEYSQGAEAQSGGLMGPTPISQPHPTLAARLKTAKPGQVLPPIKVGDWSVILRLEEFIDAQFDEEAQQKIMDHLFQTWLQEAVTERMSQFSIS
jgi:parvulin-like peptidyl-prolyl isomerase